MVTQAEVPGIIEFIQQRLEQVAQERGVRLQVCEEDSRLDDDWLYVCITPAEPGVRASDYAEVMSQIERQLRDQGAENVLLVPTVAE